MLIPQQQRDTAVAALTRLDILDVLAAIGALPLLPENANATFRLEAAAGVASTAALVEGLTDEFLFHYRSFVVHRHGRRLRERAVMMR